MKHLKYIVMAFAVALLAASCSQDELLNDGGDTPVTGQTQTYTFTVSPDIVMEGDAKTRSEGTQEEMPTRCLMQAVKLNGEAEEIIEGVKESNGNYTFEARLASNTSYTYLFWADNAETAITDLTGVPYTAGTVAFAASTTGTPESAAQTPVSLKHAVTKLTLQTTTETSAEAGEAVRVTATCASSYNVAAPASSTFSSQTAEKVFEVATNFTDDNPEVATFYFIPTDKAQDVDVEFHLLKQTIQNISLAANSHITLQGDLSEDNPKWGATSEYAQKQINYFFKQKDGTTSEGTFAGGVYRFYLPAENIADLEAVLSAIFHKNVKLDLTVGYIIFEEVLDNDYTFKIMSNRASQYLEILINNNKTYVVSYHPEDDGTYANFTVVSNKLNQSTE